MVLKVLITEDEVIQANDLENIVTDLGHEVVGVAMNSQSAVLIAAQRQPDLAFVDIHLADGPTGTEVARQITEITSSAVIFTTSNPAGVPEDFAQACGVLEKPLSVYGVHSVIRFVSDCLAEGRARRPLPRCLTLAPAYAKKWSPT